MRLLAMTLMAILATTPASIALACTQPANAAAIESGLIDWINAERKKKGLARLAPNPALEKAATAHACDMATKGYFSHTGKNGKRVEARMRAQGYKPMAFVENLALMPGGSVAEVASAWRNSGSHWKNVLNRSIREIGIGVGVASDGKQVYYVFVGGSQ